MCNFFVWHSAADTAAILHITAVSCRSYAYAPVGWRGRWGWCGDFMMHVSVSHMMLYLQYGATSTTNEQKQRIQINITSGVFSSLNNNRKYGPIFLWEEKRKICGNKLSFDHDVPDWIDEKSAIHASVIVLRSSSNSSSNIHFEHEFMVKNDWPHASAQQKR